MEDDEFFSAMYDLPISITGMPLTSAEFDDFRAFSKADMWSYALVPSLYEPEHSHDYFEIDCVLQGHCELEFEGSNQTLPANSLLVITPGSKHRIMACGKECRTIRLHMRPQFFDATFFDILSSNQLLLSFFSTIVYGSSHSNYLLFNIENNPQIRKTMKSIFYEIHMADEFSNKAAISGVNMLFCHLLRARDSFTIYRSNASRSIHDLPQMLSYISRNYRTITLNRLAEEFHYSTSHVCRCIKEYTGQNFSDIIQFVKLEKACGLLSATNMSISDITEYIGYASPSYFSRAFKKQYGITPQAFRKSRTDPRNADSRHP